MNLGPTQTWWLVVAICVLIGYQLARIVALWRRQRRLDDRIRRARGCRPLVIHTDVTPDGRN